jgi:hypothetical protein
LSALPGIPFPQGDLILNGPFLVSPIQLANDDFHLMLFFLFLDCEFALFRVWFFMDNSVDHVFDLFQTFVAFQRRIE